MKAIARVLGIDPDTTGHPEKLISGVGGFLGIIAIMWLTAPLADTQGFPLIIASMGASAVLLFAAPHGKLSQPWNLLAGHAISAVVGVFVAQQVGPLLLAGPLAVGGAITAMYYLRCTHPPGGATALVAVIGGDAIRELGYQYALTPILLNALIILVIAVLVNAAFHWRRYPPGLYQLFERPQEPVAGTPAETERSGFGMDDLHYALGRIGSYIDVSEDDLTTIYRLAREHADSRHVPLGSIHVGGYYSNGDYGHHWSVRQVVDTDERPDGEGLIIYKTVAGKDRRQSGTCTRDEFARWARYEVFLNENSWQRVS